MPDFLLSILIGLSLCYAAGRRIRPLPLKIALIAVLTVLTLLSCLDIPAARYPLITAGMLLIAAACWNGRKQPERVPALLLFVVLFGLLPVIGLVRQWMPGTYPYRGEGWQEDIFYCVISLPAGLASVVSLIRILLEKHGRNGQKEVD